MDHKGGPMQRPMLMEIPVVRAMTVSSTPMHRWPTLVKRGILWLGVILCIGLYAVMGAGLVSLIALISGLK